LNRLELNREKDNATRLETTTPEVTINPGIKRTELRDWDKKNVGIE
jgi:hypothetical protein